ncbi:MAG: DUF262 domain-containing protein [Patescibacteria group bacterium]|jgi:hypothetical protein
MSKITNERIGEYLKTALNILDENGGEYPASDLIEQMEKRLDFDDHEKSIYKAGSYLWLTKFRFASIGLSKAKWIQKGGGVWRLEDDNREFKSMSPIEIFNFSRNSYDEWASSRDSDNDDYEEIEENDEPEILMEVEPGHISFDNLLSDISSCRIQIPPFQRSFVWSANDIRYLLDSIYRGYPIGSFIFWKTTRKLPFSRKIGNINLSQDNINIGTQISFVLDGQQRITSLFAAIKDSVIDDENFRFLFNLRAKKFIVKKSDESDERKDIESLLVPVNSLFSGLAAYNSVAQQYPREYQEILVTLFERFNKYRFSVINVIDKAENDDNFSKGIKQVVNMFSRINDTGRKLTVVAKMVARCWGEDFDLRKKLDNFFGENEYFKSIREETVLQVASAILNFKKCRSRDILEKTNVQKLNSEWGNITNSILLSLEFIKNKLNIKNLDYLPFEALLVPLSYIHYKKKHFDHLETKNIENWFWKVCLSNRYGSTVESKIEEDCDKLEKIILGEEVKFDYLIDWETLKSRLISQRYNLRNAFVKTVLSLYSNCGPKNLSDGREVSLDGAFTGYFRHNLHHVFPQAYLRRNEADKKDLFDSVVNIMFIPAITNNNILDQAPNVYFLNLSRNENFKEILNGHLILDLNKSGLLENNFLYFLNYRADYIVRWFRLLTGVSSSIESEFETNPTKPIDITESKIRGFIYEKLKAKANGSFWSDCIPSDIRFVVDNKIKDHVRRHPYKLEDYLNDETRINFLEIMDYCKIILSNWNVFSEYFSSKGETERHFLALKNYRNPVKHGRDLNEVDKRNGEASILWLDSVLG